MLRDETQGKKSFHIEKFVEKTILNSESTLEPSTVFALLKSIEQMTWRQFCLLEGFRRQNPDTFRIRDYDKSGIDGMISPYGADVFWARAAINMPSLRD